MTIRRRTFTLAAAAGPLGWALPAAQAQAPEGDAALRAAVAGAHRSDANRARDAARHPVETLQFFGLAADHAVVEAAPGGGWFTEILAPYLRARGRLVAAHEAVDDPSDYRRRSRAQFDAKLAAAPALYDRVRVGVLPRTPGADALAALLPPGGADRVLTFRNVHNWLEAGHLDATLQAFHALLKPGGVLGVEEHRAPPGSTPAWMARHGYVAEDWMAERARAAGFVLQARSEVNANPRDGKDHPHGVWSLPPTLRGGAQDRERFLAIGESDRFTHRYVKPA